MGREGGPQHSRPTPRAAPLHHERSGSDAPRHPRPCPAPRGKGRGGRCLKGTRPFVICSRLPHPGAGLGRAPANASPRGRYARPPPHANQAPREQKRDLRRETRGPDGRGLPAPRPSLEPGPVTRRGCGPAEGRRRRSRAFTSRLLSAEGLREGVGRTALNAQREPLKKKIKSVNGCFLSQAAAVPRSRSEPAGQQPCPRARREAVSLRCLCIPKPQPRVAAEALFRKAPVPLSVGVSFSSCGALRLGGWASIRAPIPAVALGRLRV